MDDLYTLLGAPVTDPEEEAFVVFSQAIPSQSLGFIDSQAAEVEITIRGRELNIRQSRGLLTSDRKEGTTGAVVWKVTPLFAEWVASPNFLFQANFLRPDSIVLELGAGVAGIVALMLAPLIRKYIATDQDYVLRLLQQNISANLKTPVPPSSSAKPKLKGKKKDDAPPPSNPNNCGTSNIETFELDWELNSVASLPTLLGLQNSKHDGQGIDVVIACDCIYNESLIEPLNNTCAQLCKLRSSSTQENNNRPTLCLVAQQLRSYDVFEAWFKSFHGLFHVWQVPDGHLTAPLRENSGFIVHVGVVR